MVQTRSQSQIAATGTVAATKPTVTITKAAARRARDSEPVKVEELNRRCYVARQQQLAKANATYLGIMKYLGT